jgi:glycosyltransferase involved in cell wall biosynthesis
MSDFNPLVSIVIPVHNGSNYLREAIESALTQTYKNIEVLVINDGSTDNGETEKIALTYGNNIKYYKKPNGGVASALNVGIEKMQGEYFSWLSHDDLYFPDKILNQIDILKNGTDKNIVLYSDIVYIDSDSKVLSYLKLPHYEPKMFRPAFIQSGLINGCTLLVPKICFEICGIFNVNLKTTQDYDMWFRISEKFEFKHICSYLIYSRIHPNQGSMKLKDIVLYENNLLYINFLKKIKRSELIYFSKNNITRYYAEFSKNMAESKFDRAKNYAFVLALLNFPLSGFMNWETNLKLIILLIIKGRITKLYHKIKPILKSAKSFNNNSMF